MQQFIDLDHFFPQTQEELEIAKQHLTEELMKRGMTGQPSKDKPWQKYYLPEQCVVSPPQMRMTDYLYERNKNRLDLNAFNYMSKQITYEELFFKIDDTAKRFKKYGVKESDYVCLALPVSPETIYMVYALEKIGASAALIDPRVNEERMKYYLTLTEARFVGITGVYAATMRKSCGHGRDMTMLNISPLQSFGRCERILLKLGYAVKMMGEMGKEFLYNIMQARKRNHIISSHKFYRGSMSNYQMSFPQYQEDRTAVVEFTSGTTGVPKGLALSASAINLVVEQLKDLIDCPAGQTILGIMPPFISYGMVCGTHNALACGLESILIPRFSPELFPRLVLEHRPNNIVCVPAFLQLLKDSSLIDRQTDLSFIQNIIVGGDKTEIHFEKVFNQWLKDHNCGVSISKGGGMAEYASVLFYTPYESTKKPGVYGIPLPMVDAKVVGEDGNELGYYEIGEIHVASQQGMKGYIGDEKETEEFFYFDENGKRYGRTGDLGYVDINGFFTLLNRKKQMIIRPDGHNVFPSEIRAVINEHLAVRDSVVVGRKDGKVENGLWPTAYIELNPDCENRQKILKEIKRLCEIKLPLRDRPRESDYYLVKKICFTSEGKIDAEATTDESNYE